MEYLDGKIQLYNIDVSYVQALYNEDKEVFFDNAGNYNEKPYVGIIVVLKKYKYFIPLTSAKNKHLTWHNVTNTNYIIYEITGINSVKSNWVYRPIANTRNVKHILSVLEIKKMIPVPDGKYTKIDLNNLTDINRKNLLQKEYNFLKPIKTEILNKAKNIYTTQIDTGIVYPFHCNFKKLETIHDRYMP